MHRADRALLDVDAKDAIDALIRRHHAREEGRTQPAISLGERAERVFQSVRAVCEWRLGRSPLPGRSAMSEAPVPVSDPVKRLWEIEKSIPRWSRQGGRKGRPSSVLISSNSWQSIV